MINLKEKNIKWVLFIMVIFIGFIFRYPIFGLIKFRDSSLVYTYKSDSRYYYLFRNYLMLGSLKTHGKTRLEIIIPIKNIVDIKYINGSKEYPNDETYKIITPIIMIKEKAATTILSESMFGTPIFKLYKKIKKMQNKPLKQPPQNGN